MIQIPTEVRDEPPHEAEEEPGDCVDQDEDEEVQPPLEVHQSGEDVCQVAVCLTDISMMDIALPVLPHIPLDLLSSGFVHQLFREVFTGWFGPHGLPPEGRTFYILLHLPVDSSLGTQKLYFRNLNDFKEFSQTTQNIYFDIASKLHRFESNCDGNWLTQVFKMF